MIIGFGGCSDYCADFMATGTLSGGSFEYTSIVATFAIDSYVAAGKGKASSEMIEISRCRRPSRAAQCNKNQADEYGRYRPIHCD